MAHIVPQIQEIGCNIERFAGEAVAQVVMEDSDRIKNSTRPAKVAAWVSGAMERLDAQVAEETRVEIMLTCGRNCALANGRVIERAQARRRKYGTEAAFLDAEQRNPPTGTRIVREGDTLYQYYMPGSYSYPMRCYCSLMRGLPADQTTSSTYCQCSRGFAQTFWENVLNRPVTVDIGETCLTGAQECQFIIHL
jgi:hypothetical protein